MHSGIIIDKMASLSFDRSDERQTEETRLLRALSPQEGLRQFLALMAEFALHLQETEPLYREERMQAMIALQSRLRALGGRKRKP
ncbi:MAG: hypothetical protein RMJ60_05285 [Anaerolineales bacterium]|nr:hypothetical protein [Anaerolineales bacterium]